MTAQRRTVPRQPKLRFRSKTTSNGTVLHNFSPDSNGVPQPRGRVDLHHGSACAPVTNQGGRFQIERPATRSRALLPARRSRVRAGTLRPAAEAVAEFEAGQRREAEARKRLLLLKPEHTDGAASIGVLETSVADHICRNKCL